MWLVCRPSRFAILRMFYTHTCEILECRRANIINHIIYGVIALWLIVMSHARISTKPFDIEKINKCALS